MDTIQTQEARTIAALVAERDALRAALESVVNAHNKPGIRSDTEWRMDIHVSIADARAALAGVRT